MRTRRSQRDAPYLLGTARRARSVAPYQGCGHRPHTTDRGLWCGVPIGFKHDVVGEQGGPEERVAAIGVGAANEFMAVAAPLAVIPTDEFTFAKLADDYVPHGPMALDDGFEV